MTTHEAVKAAIREATNQGSKGCEPKYEVAMLLLTDRQYVDLVNETDNSHWSYSPRGNATMFLGITVVTVPPGLFYTPRALRK